MPHDISNDECEKNMYDEGAICTCDETAPQDDRAPDSDASDHDGRTAGPSLDW